MKFPKLVTALAGVAVIGLLSGCEELETAGQTATQAVKTAAATVMPPPNGYWHGDGVSGKARIVVHIHEQKAYFYKGKTLVGESTVSTGKPGFSTPPGHYHVVSKSKDHISSIYGDFVDDEGNIVKTNIDVRKDRKPRGSHFDGARMPYAMFFNGGYAMHEGYVPPYAASHGCIRLPKEWAPHFFNASSIGTPLVVKP